MTSAAGWLPVRRVLGQVWVLPALAMLFVGGFRVGTPEFWRDEVSTWTAATRSFGDLLRLLQHVDASNGFYYLLLHGWTQVFGDSVISLRMPSVLAMTAAAAFVALTAERLFGGRAAGISAGLLFAVVPEITRYAQEARSYALVTCGVAAATWFLVRALDRPGWQRWAPYSVAMAVAGAGHLISLSTVAGQVAVVLLHLWRTRSAVQWRLLWQYPLAVAVAALPVIPVMMLGNEQSGRQLGWIVRPEMNELVHLGDSLFGGVGVYHAFTALALLALLLPGRRLPALQMLLLAALPAIAVWVVSRNGTTSYFLERYMLFTVPAWAVLGGGGIGTLYALVTAPRRSRTAGHARAAGVLLTVGLLTVPLVEAKPALVAVRTVYGHTWARENFRAAADLIAAGYRPGDGVAAPLGNQSWSMIGPGVDFYLPDGVEPFPVFVEQSAAQAEDLFPAACPQPANCLGQAQRIWLLVLGDTADPMAALPGDQSQALRAHYGAPSQVTALGGVTVALLDRTG
ncbi:glycosyltransferase family 39 protein [Kitasatospora sp. NPDC052868]|uniref:glycosyltransferase family 39 protein n=1 Tax=Kitasatospora sp. NPDC052868 TaxID=3364060 RepID=UPI0037C70047